MSKQPEAFKLGVPAADLVDLRERLAHTRWPDQAPGPAWAYGTDLGWMRELVEYWRDSFDWRAQEERLNAFPQYKVKLNGIDLHFLHVRGEGLNPCPLLLSHGWPGFSRGQPRFGVEAIADCFAALMTDVLGYNRFGAQGGDWGSFITSRLAYAYRDRLIGIHLNLMPLRRDPKMVDDPTSDEQKYLGELAAWLKEETGYQWIQGTRPQTLAFALADSPVGLILPPGSSRNFAHGQIAEGIWSRCSRRARFWQTSVCIGSPGRSVLRSGRTTRACMDPGPSLTALLFSCRQGTASFHTRYCARHARWPRACLLTFVDGVSCPARSFCSNGAARIIGEGTARVFQAASHRFGFKLTEFQILARRPVSQQAVSSDAKKGLGFVPD